jgi:chromate transporter
MSSYPGQDRKALTLIELFLSFLRLGVTAFGGPAIIPYIADFTVNRKKWLDQETLKKGLVLCQSLPGATGMQLTAYIGLKKRGIPGALLSFIGFGLPAFLLMVAFSSIYMISHDLRWVQSLFAGLQVIVVSLVAMATYTFGRATLKRPTYAIVASASALAFWTGVSPFLIIIGAAIAGIGFSWEGKPVASSHRERKDGRLLTYAGTLILAVLVGLLVLYFFDTGLLTLALLMLKIDLFAFGGGLSSVPLMLREVVTVHGWIDSKSFMDGIALGQVTPGPIVITATFVGMLTHGLAGAVVATLAIFAPSFILLIATAPFLDQLNQSKLFSWASQGVLASFVGLLLFVTMKFATAVPWDLIRIVIASASLAALMRKVDTLYVITIGALVSLALL